ncbi:AGAP006874-PA-like protein [Anopheles sinensis]|uniref:Gustatory receptor n=1 Tax=Anopheles sinensis TaxID=74873 RepID=A0A084W698_ANOSI|nr:AGAP006874-PA-like protein [Anopheles sinensis]
MNRMQNEVHSYYRTLLADTFGMVMKISQWVFTAPYPLHPYQQVTSASRQRFYVLRFLQKCFAVLIFGTITAMPVLMYFLHDKSVYMYSVPMSIKIMYYMQTALQVVGTWYVVYVYQFRTSIHRYYFGHLLHVLEQFGRRDIDVGLRRVKRAVRIVILLIPVQIGMVALLIILQTKSWRQFPKLVTLGGTLLGTTINLQYMTIMGTVAILLRQMNDTLESFLTPTSDVQKTMSIQLIQPTRLTVDDQLTIEKIRLLQLELMKVVAKTNASGFGTFLCIFIIATFMYINILLLQVYQGLKQNVITFDIFCIRLINCAFKLWGYVMIAYSNRLVQKQNLRVGTILHQLNKVDNQTTCFNIINRFITQTCLFYNVHEAHEMIPIDMSLIFKAI